MKLHKNIQLLVFLLIQFWSVAHSYIKRGDPYGTCNGAFDTDSIKDRIDCGYPGISRELCEQRGCCFDDMYINTYFCFHLKTSNNGQCGFDYPESNRVECGWPNITYKECVQQGCCFDNTVVSTGVKQCFYTQTASNPTCNFDNPADMRSDCGWPGITYSQCIAQGCCFDAHALGFPFCFCSHNHPYDSEEQLKLGIKAEPTNGLQTLKICKCFAIEVNQREQKRTINVKCGTSKIDQSKLKVVECSKENPRKAKFTQQIIIDSLQLNLVDKTLPHDDDWVIECQYSENHTYNNYVSNKTQFYEDILQQLGSELCRLKPSTQCPKNNYINDIPQV